MDFLLPHVFGAEHAQHRRDTLMRDAQARRLLRAETDDVAVAGGAERDAWRELAHHEGGGISVRLVWHPPTDQVLVEVSDELTGEEFVLEPPKALALAAFDHPYALRQSTRDEGAALDQAA